MKDNTPYCLAEAGSCHEGNLNKAFKLIDVAAKCGADGVKFQYWSDPALMRKRRNVPGAEAYIYGPIKREWLPDLRARCELMKIDFVCSVFLPQDVATLEPWICAFKISSFEAMDAELVKACPTDRPLIISTGMCDAADVGKIINSCDRPLILLTCVSSYPCPLEESSLGAMRDGYSDHTKDIYTGGLAVAAGAKFLEVHFMLDDTKPQVPDYCVSHNPLGLKHYIKFARRAQRMMTYDGRPHCEADMRKHRVCSS